LVLSTSGDAAALVAAFFGFGQRSLRDRLLIALPAELVTRGRLCGPLCLLTRSLSADSKKTSKPSKVNFTNSHGKPSKPGQRLPAVCCSRAA